MRLRFLLDTNVLSEPLRARPDEAVVRRVEAHQAEIAIPATAWAELRFGCLRLPPGRKRDRIAEYLLRLGESSAPILPFDRAAADWHAAERARLERRGVVRSFADAQVAAIAVVNELTLVTRNGKDFAAFADLRLASWHSD